MSGYETEIDPTGKKLPGTLIQKILLLRALVNQPNILLLEEPWNGLEPECKTSLISYLLKNPNNATILISSNDPDFAEKADYHIQLSNGLATVIVK
jgi:ABC-type bacteriocin/lantibiotic exporter with double-glycine peptidase domain